MPPRRHTQSYESALPKTVESTKLLNDIFGPPRDRPNLPIVFAVSDKSLDMPILEIVFHAISLLHNTDGRGRPLLHWRLSGVTEIVYNEQTNKYSGSCIGLEMTSQNQAALTVMKSLPYPWSNDPYTYQRLSMGPQGNGVTVKMLLKLLLEDWGVHRFELSGQSSGCLHWSSAVVWKLEQAGIVQQGAVRICEEVVAKARQAGDVWIPDNARGRFFSPALQGL